MAEIKPTVGRVVWYTQRKPESRTRAMNGPPRGPFAAIIVYVHSDHLVNLVVFDANGQSHPITSVNLLRETETPELADNLYGHYCDWIPFQKGQAAKTEALEKQIAVG